VSKYFSGRFLISKIAVTVVILVLLTLTQYGLISNSLSAFFMIGALIGFFIIDGNLRKNEQDS